MSQDVCVNRELLSALVDGQLRGAEFARVVAMATDSVDGLAVWHGYQIVGDVLRCPELAACQHDQAFVARLRQRLVAAHEMDRAPMGLPESDFLVDARSLAAPSAHRERMRREGANDYVTRWKLLAGAASVAAAAAFGWHLVGGDEGPGQAARTAAGTTVAAPTTQSGVPGPAEPQVMLRDARLDELMAAHKQFGGTSALQMPAGFLRNATFENPGR